MSGVRRGGLQGQLETRALRCDPDERQLRDAGDRDAPDQRTRHVAAEPCRCDHQADQNDVEQHGRRRCRRETPCGVQHAGKQRGKRNEENVGKGDAPEFDRKTELLLPGKSGRQRVNQPGHHGERYKRQDDQDAGEAREGIGSEAVGILSRLEPLGEHRHKGHVECPFGEEAAEHVGQPERHDIGLVERSGAEVGEDDGIPNETENAAQKRPAPHREKARHQADGGQLSALSTPSSMAVRRRRSSVRCLVSE